MTSAAAGLALPDYLGIGWLDEHSVRTTEGLTADYVSGEDLVYRVTANGSQWTLEEFYRLQSVDRAEGKSLPSAIASLIGRQRETEELPPAWRRLQDRAAMRADAHTRISVVYRHPPPMVFYPMLDNLQIVGAWGDSLAPDLRPKSFKVHRDRPPRNAGWHIIATQGWYGELVAGHVSVSRCAIGTYATPIINVEPVLEALIGPHERFKPPIHLIVRSPAEGDVVADPATGALIVLRDVEHGEARKMLEAAMVAIAGGVASRT